MSDLDALAAEADRIAGPGPAKCPPRDRDESMARAKDRFAALVRSRGPSVRDFAETIGCDESAVRRAIRKGLSLPIPWWLEVLIDRDPELVAGWVKGILRDCAVSKAARGHALDA